MSGAAHHHNDKPAAFRGLVITSILLFVLCLTIVKLTNIKFASHETEAAPAGEAKR